MNGSPAPTLDVLTRSEPRRDFRAGADVAAVLLQGAAFARMLDATLVRGGGEPRPPAPEAAPAFEPDDGGATVVRTPAPASRDGGEAERTTDRRASQPPAAADEAQEADEPVAAEKTKDAAAADDVEEEPAAESAEGADAPEGDDGLADMIRLMRPTALRAFHAAVVGGLEAAAAPGGPGAPAGRPFTTAAATGAGAPEAPTPPARIAGQVLLALGRAEGLADGNGRVRLALDPAHLGKVEITVSRRDGQLDVTFRVESAEAEHALRSRAGELGQALLGRGGGWSEVSVTVVRESDEDEQAAGRHTGDGRSGGGNQERDDGSAAEEGEAES